MNKEPIKITRLDVVGECVEIPEFQQIEYETVIRNCDSYYVSLKDFAAHLINMNSDMIDSVGHTEDCLSVYLKEDCLLDSAVLVNLVARLTGELHASWWIEAALRTKNIDTPYEREYPCLVIKVNRNFSDSE